MVVGQHQWGGGGVRHVGECAGRAGCMVGWGVRVGLGGAGALLGGGKLEWVGEWVAGTPVLGARTPPRGQQAVTGFADSTGGYPPATPGNKSPPAPLAPLGQPQRSAVVACRRVGSSGADGQWGLEKKLLLPLGQQPAKRLGPSSGHRWPSMPLIGRSRTLRRARVLDKRCACKHLQASPLHPTTQPQGPHLTSGRAGSSPGRRGWCGETWRGNATGAHAPVRSLEIYPLACEAKCLRGQMRVNEEIEKPDLTGKLLAMRRLRIRPWPCLHARAATPGSEHSAAQLAPIDTY